MVPFPAGPDSDGEGLWRDRYRDAVDRPDWWSLDDNRTQQSAVFAADAFLANEVDAALVDQVADRLMAASEIRGRLIRVTVQNSVVILEGSVESWAVRTAARRLAWATPGVLDVCNMLVADN